MRSKINKPWATDLPVTTTVNGVTVSGFVRELWPSGMFVEMTSPSTASGDAPHIPYFAMAHSEHYADRAGLTAKGKRVAEQILRSLYESRLN